jgi:DHA3 family macrolide efflux protein-like MFS transporter
MPLNGILAIDLATALLAVAPLLFIAIPLPPRTALSAGGSAVGASVWSDMRAGLRYVWAWPGLLAVSLLAMLLNFVLVPSTSLMPLLVTQHFKGGALQLGWLESALGIGVVAGGLTLSAWGGFRRRIVTSLSGVIGIGLGVALVGAAPAAWFSMALAGNFVAGFMSPLTNGPFMAIIQARVAPEMQGRVLGLIHSGSAAMMPVSLLIAGPLADAVGVQMWYIGGGLLCAGMGVLGFLIPAILRIEENGHQAGPLPGAAM